MNASEPIPSAPGALPVLGHLVPLLRAPLTFLTSLAEQGDLVRIRLGPVGMLVVCDPELTWQVLHDDRTFDKGGPFTVQARDVVGNGLATCPHSEHRRQRRLAQPAFHPRRLPDYAGQMSACITDVTGSWHEGQIIDVPSETARIANRVLTATLFSEALPERTRSRLLDDMATVLSPRWYRRMLTPAPLRRLPTPGNREYQRARSRLRRSLDGIVARRRTGGTDHGDLLSALLAARDPETGGHGLTDTEITDEVTSFFLAGTETTSAILAWALYLLGRHPHIERRLHTEADTVLSGNPPVHDHLPRLELTRRIITETLRMYPPIWFLTRTVTADTRLGHHALPVSTTVLYSPYLIHHRSDLYDNPSAFDPDRWAPARPQPPRHAFVPFGGGARKCIGDVFGMTESVLALAAIAGRWHLHPLSEQDVSPAPGASLRPPPFTMRVTSRAVSPPVMAGIPPGNRQ
ncbi:cytochrome P450 [Streptomyces sp. ET3-23]|uniref:cytochrome P450 n=1 Tax=Streptomyces sp. ET3-23 TaxID=2885643 RepID=UPI001D114531|nr:cytochrome P450 [Streptomyces sp. ET3-23]MCC2276042.1 cytochrome P450 [Streptomyces sp. ET3-23]